MNIDEILNPYVWLLFWIVVFPVSIYRLWRELKKKEGRNLCDMIEPLIIFIISIIYLVYKL